MYRLRTLGGAALLRDGAPVDSIGGQRKLLALLALLGAAGGRGMSRERVASLLWPESDTERARGALKQSLHVLRRQLGSADIVQGTAELRLNTGLVTADVTEFADAVASGDHARAVSLYGGPFLDGFHVAGAAEFEQWCDEQRGVLAAQHARAVDALAVQAHESGAFAEAAALWRRLQAADPFSARAAVGLMDALEATGERAAALRAGQAFQTLVREELGVAVDASVSARIEQLRQGPRASPRVERETAAPPVQAAPPAAPAAEQNATVEPIPAASAPMQTRDARRSRHTSRRVIIAALVVIALIGLAVWRMPERSEGGEPDETRSIAVIPFVNTSDNAEDGHFADGLTDELISTLGRVEGLRVAARTSTFALKGRGLSARAFADTLGVGAVIEGTVRRQADRLKITAQLVDPTNNSVTWSQSYDRRLGDMIAVQEEIALALVRALRAEPPVRDRPRATAVVDPEAWDLYLRGRYNWDLPLRERLQQSVRFHQRAVERDPQFAAAYAGLAEAYVNMAIYGHMPADEALARANVSAARALELDPQLVEALTARAYVRMSELEFAGAEADLRRALEVNANYAWARHFYSLYFMMIGRPDEAERQNRRALVLDPLSLPANANRGIVQAQLGNLDAAERELERALQLRADFTLTVYYLGAVRAARGSHVAALEALETAARHAPDYPGVPGARAFVLRRLGRTAEADAVLAALTQRSGEDPRARANHAFAEAASGRIDAAVSLLNGVRWDVPTLIGLRADPLLASFRADARVASLLQSLAAQR